MDKEKFKKIKEEKMKNKTASIKIDGYLEEVKESGDIICTYISFRDSVISELAFFVESYPKKEDLVVVVKTVNINDKLESSRPIRVKSHQVMTICNYPIKRGDCVSISIEYENSKGIKPKGIWVSAYGQ